MTQATLRNDVGPTPSAWPRFVIVMHKLLGISYYRACNQPHSPARWRETLSSLSFLTLCLGPQCMLTHSGKALASLKTRQ